MVRGRLMVVMGGLKSGEDVAMARAKRSWREKLADAKAKMPEAHRFYCEKSRSSGPTLGT